jgi:superfamily II DNA/RNA helicase
MENQIQKAISNLKIEALNEMQIASIEANKGQEDCVLLSPTGSGKTLAFLLPLLGHLNANLDYVQALIVTPSRELAIQIEEVFRSLGTNSTYGGHSIKVEENNFTQAPAVLVGTPGRICDHVNRGNLDLSKVKTLILDEFDKSLEMGFQEEMGYIVGQLNSLQKRMLISATEMKEIPSFTGIIDPIQLNFLSGKSEGLTLKLVMSEDKDKLQTLFDLLCQNTNESTIVFCNHRDTVERISDFLTEMGVVNTFFHGGLDQTERERTMIKFRNGSSNYLITTDLAARGLDIPEIKYIIHYHMAPKEDGFIHRNGRTARMSATGTSFLLMSRDEDMPDYIKKRPETVKLKDDNSMPKKPEWVTLYLSGGKKDKINKIDIVGFLSKKGNLEKFDLGLIIVQDFSSFASVKRNKVSQLLQDIQNEKVKGKKLKIEIAQ